MSGRAPHRRFARWIHQGWSRGRWRFVAILTTVAVFTTLAWAGGIIVVINNPPPFTVLVIFGVVVLVQIWRWASSDPEPDNYGDCTLLVEPDDAAEHPAQRD